MFTEANWNYRPLPERAVIRTARLFITWNGRLFESADTTKKVDLSLKLGIPPVYTVDYKSVSLMIVVA